MTSFRPNSLSRRGFTLVELMVSIFIVSILASFILLALNDVRERAKEQRAETEVVRAHQLLMRNLDAYRTRSVPLYVPDGASPAAMAMVPSARLLVLRDLMRMEVPDRKTDVIDPPAALPPSMSGLGLASRLQSSGPALQRVYRTRAMRLTGSANLTQLDANWSAENQGSECLYLILSVLQEGDSNGVDFFKQSEIGDTDGDGMLELLDPWGSPIAFLRWAPALDTPMQIPRRVDAPDPFDPVHRDQRWSDNTSALPYALFPMIMSPGPDKALGVVLDNSDPTTPLHYRNTFYGGNAYPNDPYTQVTDAGLGTTQLGAVNNAGAAADNIFNHTVEAD